MDDFRFPYVRMERMLDRPTLVSWKFVPTNAAEIYRWWDLWQLRQHLFDAGCAGGTAGIPVRYLLVLRPGTLGRVADCGAVAWSNGTEALVRLEPRGGTAPGGTSALTRPQPCPAGGTLPSPGDLFDRSQVPAAVDASGAMPPAPGDAGPAAYAPRARPQGRTSCHGR